MTNKFTAHRVRSDAAHIEQLSMTREWMEKTHARHAYHCFPVSLSNRLGWAVSFPEDISFIWNGNWDSSPDTIKVLKGEKYISTGRGQATVSFNTGLVFQTDEDVSLLAMPVPNQFIDGVSTFTTLLSTSFFRGDLPIVWMVTRPNVEITIPAGTPVAAVLPISLGKLQEFELTVMDAGLPQGYFNPMLNYGEISQEIMHSGKWAHFYRNATNAYDQPLGTHETKSLKLSTIYLDKDEENKASIQPPVAY